MHSNQSNGGVENEFSETPESIPSASLPIKEEIAEAKAQENFRGRTVVLILVIYLGVTIFGIGIYIQFHPDPDRSLQLLNLVWTSLVTLVSGALGFYFGSSKNSH